MMMERDLVTKYNREGRPYCTKGEYRKYWYSSWKAGTGPDLCEGETFDMWFNLLIETFISDGWAAKVGNHYEVYLDV